MARIPRILVISSANIDLTQQMARVPNAGETILGDSYCFTPGGKGANAAIAVARLNGDSVFCTRLGNDAHGRSLISFYEKSGIDTRFVAQDAETPTGLASVMVEESGANRIAVFPGANAKLSRDDVENAMTCFPDAVFIQFEIPAPIAVYATQLAKGQGIPVFVDAGPGVKDFPLNQLENVEIFSPNETEAYLYTGIQPSNVDNCLRVCMALTKLVRAKY